MKGVYRGAPKKGCPARGSWGDRYIIENHRETNKISCSKCINYCQEDMSCNVKPVYCPVDGWDLWKHCDQFELETNPPKITAANNTQSNCGKKQKKENDYVDIHKAKSRDNKPEYREIVFRDGEFRLKSFIGYVRGRLQSKYDHTFIRGYEYTVFGQKMNFSLVSTDEKIFVTIKDFVYDKKGGERMEVRNSMRYIGQEAFILSKLPKEVIKILVVVKAPLDPQNENDISVAEKFYERYAGLLEDIKLVEVDNDGNLKQIRK